MHFNGRPSVPSFIAKKAVRKAGVWLRCRSARRGMLAVIALAAPAAAYPPRQPPRQPAGAAAAATAAASAVRRRYDGPFQRPEADGRALRVLTLQNDLVVALVSDNTTSTRRRRSTSASATSPTRARRRGSRTSSSTWCSSRTPSTRSRTRTSRSSPSATAAPTPSPRRTTPTSTSRSTPTSCAAGWTGWRTSSSRPPSPSTRWGARSMRSTPSTRRT